MKLMKLSGVDAPLRESRRPRSRSQRVALREYYRLTDGLMHVSGVDNTPQSLREALRSAEDFAKTAGAFGHPLPAKHIKALKKLKAAGLLDEDAGDANPDDLLADDLPADDSDEDDDDSPDACSACGADVDEEDDACMQCGTEVDEADDLGVEVDDLGVESYDPLLQPTKIRKAVSEALDEAMGVRSRPRYNKYFVTDYNERARRRAETRESTSGLRHVKIRESIRPFEFLGID